MDTLDPEVRADVEGAAQVLLQQQPAPASSEQASSAVEPIPDLLQLAAAPMTGAEGASDAESAAAGTVAEGKGAGTGMQPSYVNYARRWGSRIMYAHAMYQLRQRVREEDGTCACAPN